MKKLMPVLAITLSLQTSGLFSCLSVLAQESPPPPVVSTASQEEQVNTLKEQLENLKYSAEYDLITHLRLALYNPYVLRRNFFNKSEKNYDQFKAQLKDLIKQIDSLHSEALSTLKGSLQKDDSEIQVLLDVTRLYFAIEDLHHGTRASGQASLQSLVRRQKYPGTSNTPKKLISDQELQDIENQIYTLKQKFNQQINQVTQKNPESVQHYQYIIRYYYNAVLSDLMSLRVAMGQSVDASWRDSFELSLPQNVSRSFPLFAAHLLRKSYIGEPFIPLMLDTPTDTTSPIRLRFSENYVLGLQIGNLVNHPSGLQFMKSSKVLAGLALLRGYEQVRRLMKNPEKVPDFELSDELLKEFNTKVSSKKLVQENQLLDLESSLRESLAQSFPKEATQIPEFANSAFVQDLITTLEVKLEPEKTQQLLMDFYVVLKEAEKNLIQNNLSASLKIHSALLTKLNKNDLLAVIKTILAEAKAGIPWQKLEQLSDPSQVTSNTDIYAQIKKHSSAIQALIAKRQQSYLQELGNADSFLNSWIQSSLQQKESQLYSNSRTNMIKTLIQMSGVLQSKRLEDPVVPIVLLKTFDSTLPNTQNLQQWVSQFALSNDWAESKTNYFNLLAQETGQPADQQTLESLQKYIRDTEVKENIIKTSGPLNSNLQAKASRLTDLVTLAEIGSKLRYFDFKGNNLKVSDLNEKTQQLYLDQVNHEILDNFPILTAEVQKGKLEISGYQIWSTNTELKQILASFNPENSGHIAEAEPYFDQALKAIVNKIQNSFNQILQAQDIQSIGTILTSSLLRDIFKIVQPEFQQYLEKSYEKLFAISIADQVTQDYLYKYIFHPYVFWPTLIASALHGLTHAALGRLNLVTGFVRSFDWFFNGSPWGIAYLASVSLTFKANMFGGMPYRLYEHYQQTKEREELYLTNAYEEPGKYYPYRTSFYRYSEIQNLNNGWSSEMSSYFQSWMYAIPFLAIPLLFKAPKLLAGYHFQQDIKAAQILGINGRELQNVWGNPALLNHYEIQALSRLDTITLTTAERTQYKNLINWASQRFTTRAHQAPNGQYSYLQKGQWNYDAIAYDQIIDKSKTKELKYWDPKTWPSIPSSNLDLRIQEILIEGTAHR